MKLSLISFYCGYDQGWGRSLFLKPFVHRSLMRALRLIYRSAFLTFLFKTHSIKLLTIVYELYRLLTFRSLRMVFVKDNWRPDLDMMLKL